MEDYPRTIWYVEAYDENGKPVTSGSAVAVRLTDSNGSENERTETYLLTCAHVLRGPTSEHPPAKGFGPILSSFQVWPPGKGFDDDKGLGAEIVQNAKQSDLDEVPPDVRGKSTEDWLLLRVHDADHQNASSFVHWPIEIDQNDRVTVWGYPAGRSSFLDNIVIPTKVSEQKECRQVGDGAITLTNDVHAVGASGGGLFNDKGAFIGLHRASFAAAIQTIGIASTSLRQWLEEKKFSVVSATLEVVPDPTPIHDFELSRKNWLLRAIRGGATLVLAGLLVLCIYFLIVPPVTSQISRINLSASLLTIDDSGFAKARRPMADTAISVHPANFDAFRISPTTTDAQGNSIVEIEHAPLATGTKLKGHFVVSSVPAGMQNNAPYTTTEYGAIREGESIRKLRLQPRAFDDGESIEIQIVSFKDIRRYYITEFVRSLPSESSGAPMPASFNPTLLDDFDDELVRSTFNIISNQLIQERPAMLASELGNATLNGWPDLRGLKPNLSSVCYARIRDRPELDLYASGFVIAKDTIIVASYSEQDVFDRIGFGDNARDASAMTFEVNDVLYQSPEFQVAILDVPGLEQLPLQLESANPFSDEQSRIAVVGYPTRDDRMPPEFNEFFADGDSQKRVMPGKLVGFQESPIRNATLTHDATTSSGTGGAPVFNSATNRVAGIHLGGQWLKDRKIGYAIPIWTLLENDQIRDLLTSRGVEIHRTVAHIVPDAIVGDGYDESFLSGDRLPMPKTTSPLAPDVLKKLTFDYPHFTIVMNPNQALAWYSACNIERSTQKSIPRDRIEFRVDPRGLMTLQRTNLYYQMNEWDRGHIVSSSSIAWGPLEVATAARNAAFSFTNIAPQHQVFNQSNRGGTWGELENWILEEIEPSADRITVFAGPVFSADDPVYRGFSIPRLFWKVAVFDTSAGYKTYCWLLPQFEFARDGVPIPLASTDGALDSLKATVQQIEEATGLTFQGLGP